MAYTDTTSDNKAVQGLVAGGTSRITRLGGASLGVKTGPYKISLSLEERTTGTTAALVRIYDSLTPATYFEAKLLTAAATITDNVGTQPCTSLTGWNIEGYQRYSWQVNLPALTAGAEWVLQVNTAGNTAAVPLVFTGLTVEDVGELATGVSANPHMRAAAWSGKGSSSTDGYFGEVALTGMGSLPYNVAFDVKCRALAPAATVTLHGRSDGNHPRVTIAADGTISLSLGSGSAITSYAAGTAFWGSVHRIRTTWSATSTAVTASLYLDDALVSSATLTAAITAVSSNHRVGSATGAAQRWPGAIWDFTYTDNTTAANSRTYLMDEPMSSSTYVDSSGNAGGAMTKGTGAAAPWTAAVVSTDGRGMPWQMGSGGALYYAARQSTDVTGIVADTLVTAGTELLDPTGSLTNGVFTAPCAGTCVMTWVVSISETGAVADNMRIGASVGGGAVTTGAMSVGFAASQNRLPICFVSRPIDLPIGQILQPSFVDRTGGTFTLHADYGVYYTFTPTPVAS